jgi:integrase
LVFRRGAIPVQKRLYGILHFYFITTHAARKTFVTLSVNLGMHVEAVRGISGHTGRDTMDPYYGTD